MSEVNHLALVLTGVCDKLPAGMISKLPPELRLPIYGYVINTFSIPQHKGKLVNLPLTPPIIQGCTLIRCEAMSLYTARLRQIWESTEATFRNAQAAAQPYMGNNCRAVYYYLETLEYWDYFLRLVRKVVGVQLERMRQYEALHAAKCG